MAEGDAIKSGIGVVPEVYYDLISRVTPGGLLVLVCALSFGTQPQFEAFAKAAHELEGLGFATVFLVVFAVGGYFVGMLLTPLGWALAIPARAATWYASRGDCVALIDYLRTISGIERRKNAAAAVGYWEYDRLDRAMHDILKERNEQARVILPKLRAEASLCHNSAGAALLWLALGFYLSSSVASLVSPAAIIFGLSMIAGVFREYRLMRRQFTYLRRLRTNTPPAHT